MSDRSVAAGFGSDRGGHPWTGKGSKIPAKRSAREEACGGTTRLRLFRPADDGG